MVFEVGQRAVEMIGKEGAARATRIPARPEHEMIDDELTASVEEVGQRLATARRFECVRLFDLNPGQRQPSGIDAVAQASGFLLPREKHFSRPQPFFA